MRANALRAHPGITPCLAMAYALAGLVMLGVGACRDSQARVVPHVHAPHVHGPHDGVVAPFHGGGDTGYVELKLHDDKGDLELWIGEDRKLAKPWDLPIGATIEVEFLDVGGRKATLRARDASANADEDGKPNNRDGKTNYFIFPSRGEDAGWLKGKAFRSVVVVRFARGSAKIESEPMLLQPHTH